MFSANKMAKSFESFFLLFPGAYYIKSSYPGPQHPNQVYHKWKIRNEKIREGSHIFDFYILIFIWGHKKKQKSDHPFKRQFKCDQLVYHEDKGDLIL